jgi:uncharacterized membrane protein
MDFYSIFSILLNLAIGVLGILALVRGELPFSPTRKVTRNTARLVGIIFLAAAVAGFFEATLWVSALLLIAGLVIGWTMGKTESGPK